MLPPYSQSWTVCKLVLTVFSFCWDLIILSLALAYTAGSYAYGSAGIAAFYAVPVSVVGVAWNLAELTTFFVRSRKGGNANRRGIHPGAHIGMHLVLWLACVFGVFAALMMVMSAASSVSYCSDDDDDYYYDYCDYSSSFMTVLRAFLAMWCLALIDHFVLFVLACIDTSQRNRLKPAGIVFAQPGTAPYGAAAPQVVGMMPQAYYSPPPPQQAAMASKGTPSVPPQDYQHLTGFYAPSIPQASTQSPSPAAPAPAAVSPRHPGATSSSGEITPAPPQN